MKQRRNDILQHEIHACAFKDIPCGICKGSYPIPLALEHFKENHQLQTTIQNLGPRVTFGYTIADTSKQVFSSVKAFSNNFILDIWHEQDGTNVFAMVWIANMSLVAEKFEWSLTTLSKRMTPQLQFSGGTVCSLEDTPNMAMFLKNMVPFQYPKSLICAYCDPNTDGKKVVRFQMEILQK